MKRVIKSAATLLSGRPLRLESVRILSGYRRNDHRDNHEDPRRFAGWKSPTVLSAAGGLAGLLALKYCWNDLKVSCEHQPASEKIFSKADVNSHRTKETGIWVSYKGGVYDITEFAFLHPGGDKILLAAGGPLEPFWNMYAVHKTPEVMEILEELRIGQLDSKDVVPPKDSDDPYSSDPERHPALKPVSVTPYNAEVPEELIGDSFNTPNDIFFVRNHLPVPHVDMATYQLTIDGLNNPTGAPTVLKLEELKRRFPAIVISATLQCAGNRRAEMNRFKKVKGLEWSFTSISNADWKGVRLRDVLIAAGWTEEEIRKSGIQHVHFEGFDRDPTGQYYGASIPVEKAISPYGDVILAFEMNGEPLPLDHGMPLRVIVPGVVGARNVKWLRRIYLSDVESPSHWQQNDYKCFSPSTDWDTVDFTKAPPIQEAPIQSAITHPQNGAVLPKGTTEIAAKGYAWSGGGRGVIRIDVSADGGKSWHVAELTQHSQQSLDHMWAWTQWSVTLPVPNNGQPVELICKAIDRSYNNQPESAQGIWNLRGCLNNAWHRISVQIAQ